MITQEELEKYINMTPEEKLQDIALLMCDVEALVYTLKKALSYHSQNGEAGEFT